MHIAIDLPEEIAWQLTAAWGNMPRKTLEAVAVEGYRTGVLTRGQIGSLLGLSFWDTEVFLKERQAYLPYGQDDLGQDRADLDRALSR